MSMKPGVTAQPDASSSCSPRRFGPISRITPPSMATSAGWPGAPPPSKTVPPLTTMSAGIWTSFSTLGWIDHEFQKVPVGVAHVHARCVGATTALSCDWALDDRGAGPVEQLVERFGRPVPHEAEIPARRLRGGRAQREAFSLPCLRTMKIDHLVPDVHRHHVGMLGDVQSERSVERHHGFGVSHRNGDMVEAVDASGLLRTHARSRTTVRSSLR